MNKIENYIPTEKEIKLAESMMTRAEKEASEDREIEHKNDLERLEKAVESLDLYVVPNLTKKFPEEGKNIIKSRAEELVRSFQFSSAENLVEESELGYGILIEITKNAIEELKKDDSEYRNEVIEENEEFAYMNNEPIDESDNQMHVMARLSDLNTALGHWQEKIVN